MFSNYPIFKFIVRSTPVMCLLLLLVLCFLVYFIIWGSEFIFSKGFCGNLCHLGKGVLPQRVGLFLLACLFVLASAGCSTKVILEINDFLTLISQ